MFYCKLFLFTICSFIIQEAKIKKDRQKVTSQSAESIAGKWIEIIKKNHARKTRRTDAGLKRDTANISQ